MKNSHPLTQDSTLSSQSEARFHSVKKVHQLSYPSLRESLARESPLHLGSYDCSQEFRSGQQFKVFGNKVHRHSSP